MHFVVIEYNLVVRVSVGKIPNIYISMPLHMYKKEQTAHRVNDQNVYDGMSLMKYFRKYTGVCTENTILDMFK